MCFGTGDGVQLVGDGLCAVYDSSDAVSKEYETKQTNNKHRDVSEMVRNRLCSASSISYHS